ncbi:hypothetical protein CSUI_004621, partial [Cystoisospora suis]
MKEGGRGRRAKETDGNWRREEVDECIYLYTHLCVCISLCMSMYVC